MRILIGVQFLFAKSLICKAFSILFNDIRLRGVPKTVVAEPFSFSPITPFNEGSRGVHFRQKGCAHFNYSSRRKRKVAKPVRPKYERPCDLVSALNIKFRKASNLKAVFFCGEIWRSACASDQYFPLAVSLAAFTADIVFILQRFHNSLDGCNGYSGLFCNLLLFYRRVLCDQF